MPVEGKPTLSFPFKILFQKPAILLFNLFHGAGPGENGLVGERGAERQASKVLVLHQQIVLELLQYICSLPDNGSTCFANLDIPWFQQLGQSGVRPSEFLKKTIPLRPCFLDW